MAAKRQARLSFLRVLNPVLGIRRAAFALANFRRRRHKNLDTLMLALPSQISALPVQRGWIQRRVLGNPPLSLWDLDKMFDLAAADPRVKGVVLKISGFQIGLADLQTLRESILKLRSAGKRITAYAMDYDIASYYIASACTDIVIQPGGELMVLGLRRTPTFLRDSLDTVGVRFDSIAISPYKGAMDSLTRTEISPEGQAQLEWLLDSEYDMLVEGIAQGRKITPDAVRAMIDTAPHIDTEAPQAKYVDAVLNEEELSGYLGAKHLTFWDDAQRYLLRRWRKRSAKHIAILRVSGLMIPGDSGTPPVDIPLPLVGEERAGSTTVVQQVRSVMKDESVAAVVLYVDSGGGASNAAEAMTSALAQLAKDRPLVVYMNNVAASGGYYIATAGQWIVAQPGTITGSIGVISAKIVTNGLYDHLHVHRQQFLRGANADFLSDTAPFTDSQRARMRQTVEHIYHQFIQRVAAARKIPVESVDAIGGGRVWTGTQALANGLVDELGSLHAALAKARSLASLPDDAPVVLVRGKDKPLPPLLAEASNPAAWLTYAQENLHAFTRSTTTHMGWWWR